MVKKETNDNRIARNRDRRKELIETRTYVYKAIMTC